MPIRDAMDLMCDCCTALPPTEVVEGDRLCSGCANTVRAQQAN